MDRRTLSHEVILASSLAARDGYRLMTDLIAPRPIAWVSTVDGHGRRNLAPFSYFQAVCSRPPTVVVGVGWHGDGRPKDTLRNIFEQSQFTINHVSEPLAEAMNACSGEYAPETSEWDACAVEAAPATCVKPPIVAQALAALECKLTHAIPLGRGPTGKPSSTLVVGEVLCFHVAEGLLRRDERGRLMPMDLAQLAAVGRMGGIAYTRTLDTFEMPRPKVSPSAPKRQS